MNKPSLSASAASLMIPTEQAVQILSSCTRATYYTTYGPVLDALSQLYRESGGDVNRPADARNRAKLISLGLVRTSVQLLDLAMTFEESEEEESVMLLIVSSLLLIRNLGREESARVEFFQSYNVAEKTLSVVARYITHPEICSSGCGVLWSQSTQRNQAWVLTTKTSVWPLLIQIIQHHERHPLVMKYCLGACLTLCHLRAIPIPVDTFLTHILRVCDVNASDESVAELGMSILKTIRTTFQPVPNSLTPHLASQEFILEFGRIVFQILRLHGATKMKLLDHCLILLENLLFPARNEWRGILSLNASGRQTLAAIAGGQQVDVPHRDRLLHLFSLLVPSIQVSEQLVSDSEEETLSELVQFPSEAIATAIDDRMQYVLSACSDSGGVRLFSRSSGKQLWMSTDLQGQASSVAFGGGMTDLFAVASNRGRIALFAFDSIHSTSRKLKQIVAAEEEHIWFLSFCLDDSAICFGFAEAAMVWDLHSNELIPIRRCHRASSYGRKNSFVSHELVTNAGGHFQESKVFVWELGRVNGRIAIASNKELVRPVTISSRRIAHGIALSQKRVLTCYLRSDDEEEEEGESMIVLWDSSLAVPIRTFSNVFLHPDSDVESCAISEDGKKGFLMSSTNPRTGNGEVVVLDLLHGKAISRLQVEKSILADCFSLNGSFALLQMEDEQLKLFDVFNAHRNRLLALAKSPKLNSDVLRKVREFMF
jgi:WD40 repeat protein